MKLAQIDIPPLTTKFTNSDTLVGDIVSRFLLYALSLAGIFFFLKFLLAGFTYLTSQAEPAKIQSAFKEILNAIIGLIIVISAFFIAQIVQYVFKINIL